MSDLARICAIALVTMLPLASFADDLCASNPDGISLATTTSTMGRPLIWKKHQLYAEAGERLVSRLVFPSKTSTYPEPSEVTYRSMDTSVTIDPSGRILSVAVSDWRLLDPDALEPLGPIEVIYNGRYGHLEESVWLY